MLILVPPYSYVGAAIAFLGFAIIKTVFSFVVFGYYTKEHEKGTV
jgi:O-antigen/teichoic acid export membrane protein